LSSSRKGKRKIREALSLPWISLFLSLLFQLFVSSSFGSLAVKEEEEEEK
jgi:hypothetical protein